MYSAVCISCYYSLHQWIDISHIYSILITFKSEEHLRFLADPTQQYKQNWILPLQQWRKRCVFSSFWGQQHVIALMLEPDDGRAHQVFASDSVWGQTHDVMRRLWEERWISVYLLLALSCCSLLIPCSLISCFLSLLSFPSFSLSD